MLSSEGSKDASGATRRKAEETRSSAATLGVLLELWGLGATMFKTCVSSKSSSGASPGGNGQWLSCSFSFFSSSYSDRRLAL